MNEYPKILDQLLCASCGYGADGMRMQMNLECPLEKRICENTWDGRYALCKKIMDLQMSEEEITYLRELYEEIRVALEPQIDKEALWSVVERYREDKGFEGSQLEATLIDSAEEEEGRKANKISSWCANEFLSILRELLKKQCKEE